MKILFKNKNSEYLKTIFANKVETIEKMISESTSLQDAYEVCIFAINETINSFELANFKLFIEKLNIKSIKIYSSQRKTILTGRSLKINSVFVNEKKQGATPTIKKKNLFSKNRFFARTRSAPFTFFAFICLSKINLSIKTINLCRLISG